MIYADISARKRDFGFKLSIDRMLEIANIYENSKDWDRDNEKEVVFRMYCLSMKRNSDNFR